MVNARFTLAPCTVQFFQSFPFGREQVSRVTSPQMLDVCSSVLLAICGQFQTRIFLLVNFTRYLLADRALRSNKRGIRNKECLYPITRFCILSTTVLKTHLSRPRATVSTTGAARIKSSRYHFQRLPELAARTKRSC